MAPNMCQMTIEVENTNENTMLPFDLDQGLLVAKGEDSICNLIQGHNETNSNNLTKWLSALNDLVQRGESHLVLKRQRPEKLQPGSQAIKIIDFTIDPDLLGKNSSLKVTFFGKFARTVEVIQVSFDLDGELHGEFDLR
jgi:hypothetical protein